MKLKVLLLIGILSLFARSNSPQGWEIFQDVKFTSQYFEEVDAYFDVPTFDEELKSLENTKVVLAGHYIPMGLDSIFMLSAFSYSSCFFCGGAGPESVAEIQMEKIPNELVVDEIVKVKGTLKLNDSDISHMNFILQDSKIIEE